jgi:hypothetical protein
MTGFPIIFIGFNLINESTMARLTICEFQIAFFVVVLVMSESLSRSHQ